jgi:hypothetical protein
MEPVYLVDEEDFAVLKIREQRGYVTWSSENGSRRDAKTHAHFTRHDACKRGLSKTGRTGKEQVIRYLASSFCRTENYSKMPHEIRLTHKFFESLWSK